MKTADEANQCFENCEKNFSAVVCGSFCNLNKFNQFDSSIVISSPYGENCITEFVRVDQIFPFVAGFRYTYS